MIVAMLVGSLVALALNEAFGAEVTGIKTNLSFFRSILSHDRFREGELNTSFIDKYYTPEASIPCAKLRDVATVAAALHASLEGTSAGSRGPAESVWKQAGRIGGLNRRQD